MSNEVARKLSKKLKSIAKGLDVKIQKAAGERVAFTLIIYTPGRASYVGTCSRKEAIEQMKHLIELWEQDMPDVPAHDIN